MGQEETPVFMNELMRSLVLRNKAFNGIKHGVGYGRIMNRAGQMLLFNRMVREIISPIHTISSLRLSFKTKVLVPRGKEGLDGHWPYLCCVVLNTLSLLNASNNMKGNLN